jgi:D-inositol-3-phosphate glycosyltransferase
VAVAESLKVESPIEQETGAATLTASKGGSGSVKPEGTQLRVALLTAGRDRPYALGMGAALAGQGIQLDYIGGEMVDGPEVRGNSLIRVLNIRDQREQATLISKMLRVLQYYARLLNYTRTSKCRIFHILWNNKFELFDRTLLTAFYRLLGKRVVLTAHNVNAGKRDGNDSLLNRWSLKCQYGLAHHIFVHTLMMKEEFWNEFRVRGEKVTVIPFGINNTLPTTKLTGEGARRQLGIASKDKVVLFFGNIAPYKGLEYLVEAVAQLARGDSTYRLIIAGRPKGSEEYWARVQQQIEKADLHVVAKIEYIPDEEVEWYFKAADVLVLPYNHIFQSGVLFLGYSFGLPVVATDVGSLKEEIVVGKTGFVCRPQDAGDMARVLAEYFGSDLYFQLAQRREEIRQFANERYSWTKVGEITKSLYASLLSPSPPRTGRGPG